MRGGRGLIRGLLGDVFVEVKFCLGTWIKSFFPASHEDLVHDCCCKDSYEVPVVYH